MLLLRLALYAAVAAAAATCASAAANIWTDVNGHTGGRTFQSSAFATAPRPTGPDTANLIQRWNWTLPERDGRWKFYNGGIDAAGDVYYFGYGGGTAPVLYKLDGSSGNQTWRAPLPKPYWQSYTGDDHLLLSSVGVAVAIPGVMSYNSPIETYIAGVSMDSGKVAWYLNSSITVVQSARLTADGTTLYVKWLDHTLTTVDVRSGAVKKSIDLSSTLVAGVTYYFTLAEGVKGPAEEAEEDEWKAGEEHGHGHGQRDSAAKPSKTPKPPPPGGQTLALFVAVGNITAINTKTGKKAWSVADPTGSPFASYPGAGYVAGSGLVQLATGGNYLDPQGAAALNIKDGSVAWNTSWYSTIISAVRYPTTQGWEWVKKSDSSGYSSIQLLSSANGTTLGTGYLPSFPGSSISFTSPVAVSGDGRTGFFTGEASSCDSCGSDVYLFAFGVANPAASGSAATGANSSGEGESGEGSGGGAAAAASAIRGAAAATTPSLPPTAANGSFPPMAVNGTLYAVKINELCNPDYRYVALGPGQGQVTVWHTAGVVVYVPGPAGPQPYRPAYSKLCR